MVISRAQKRWMSRRMGGRGRELPGGNNECLGLTQTRNIRHLYDISFSLLAEHLSILFIYLLRLPSPFIPSCSTTRLTQSVILHTQSRPTHGVPYALCYVALVRIFIYDFFMISPPCMHGWIFLPRPVFSANGHRPKDTGTEW